MESSRINKPKLRKIDHISIAVKDADKLIKNWALLFGIDSWTVVDMGGTDAKGRSWKAKEYRTTINDVDIELIEPIEGRIFQSRFLETFGPGLHHIAFEVDDIEKEVPQMVAKGAKLLIQSLEHKWAYLDSGDGIIIELHSGEAPVRTPIRGANSKI